MEPAAPTSETEIAARVLGGEIVAAGGDDDSMDECTVQPLGHLDGTYFFINPDGEMRKLAARDFTDQQILSLFAGDTKWLLRKFRSFDSKGIPREDFNRKKATAALMKSCHGRGIFSLSTPLRRYGVWRYGEKIIVHAGSSVYADGKWIPAGQKFGSAIYVACAKSEQPDFDNPISTQATRELLGHITRWAFHDPLDADLVIGFLGAALLGGFPRWRVHSFLIGERGTGKSTLQQFLANLLGDQAESANNYSAAGLHQSLQDQARVLLLDEGETGGEAQTRRMNQVIGLLRLLSGGQGARILRGSSQGVAQSSTVTGCVCIAAINPPHLEPQDRSRIIEIPFDKLKTVLDEVSIEKMLDEATQRSPAMRARAVLRVKHFSEAFGIYRKALSDQECDGRQADLFATLMAGRSILIDEEAPLIDEAEDFVEKYRDRLKLMQMEDSEAGDGQICLNQLFDFILDNIRQDKRYTIGQQLEACISGTGDEKVFEAFGLRLVRLEGFPHLFVPHAHAQLNRVFNGTVWSSGGWSKSLCRLPGVMAAKHPVRVAGQKRRGVIVPFALLPKSENDHNENPPQPP
jgi:energy-coupling factor transporter ATP-binding protein EcfA2